MGSGEGRGPSPATGLITCGILIFMVLMNHSDCAPAAMAPLLLRESLREGQGIFSLTPGFLKGFPLVYSGFTGPMIEGNFPLQKKKGMIYR
jgi:hypothetical protein